MKFQKRSDSELFKELRINVFIVGIAAILVFIAGLFWTLDSYWYGFVLAFLGISLISYASQKYLQEHPKFRIALMGILLLLVVAGIVVFLILR